MARSGFYAWRQRQQNPGRRAPRENAVLTAQVLAVFERHRRFYGSGVAPGNLSTVNESPHPARLGRGRHHEMNLHTPEQIIRQLKTADQLSAQGKTVSDVCVSWKSPSPLTTAGASSTAA